MRNNSHPPVVFGEGKWRNGCWRKARVWWLKICSKHANYLRANFKIPLTTYVGE